MKNNEELRMFGEISLVIVLVLAVLDLLVTGVARAQAQRPPRRQPRTYNLPHYQ